MSRESPTERIAGVLLAVVIGTVLAALIFHNLAGAA
jgi:hypothetical protein